MIKDVSRAYNWSALYLSDTSEKTVFDDGETKVKLPGIDFFSLVTGAGFYTKNGFLYDVNDDLKESLDYTNRFLQQYRTALQKTNFVPELLAGLRRELADPQADRARIEGMIKYFHLQSRDWTPEQLLLQISNEFDNSCPRKWAKLLKNFWKRIVNYAQLPRAHTKIQISFLKDDEGHDINVVYNGDLMVIERV
jgi:hypothetical protein